MATTDNISDWQDIVVSLGGRKLEGIKGVAYKDKSVLDVYTLTADPISEEKMRNIQKQMGLVRRTIIQHEEYVIESVLKQYLNREIETEDWDKLGRLTSPRFHGFYLLVYDKGLLGKVQVNTTTPPFGVNFTPVHELSAQYVDAINKTLRNGNC